MRPYAPRPIQPHDLLERDGWRIKRYSITADGADLDWASFAQGIERVIDSLPQPAAAPGRTGVGFLIAHRGIGADFVVLGWWDRENELPLRLAVRDQHPGGAWRDPRGGESVCVWDLQVIGFERDVYVATILDGSDAPDAMERYLARTAHGLR